MIGFGNLVLFDVGMVGVGFVIYLLIFDNDWLKVDLVGVIVVFDIVMVDYNVCVIGVVCEVVDVVVWIGVV